MSKFFNFQLFFRKPKVVAVTGPGSAYAGEAILQVLKSKFRIGKDILVFAGDLKDKKESEKLKYLAEKSPLFVCVVTHFGEIPPDRNSFAADRVAVKEVLDFVKILPNKASLVLNFDDEAVREMGNAVNLKTCTFGFEEAADFRASDVNSNGRDARLLAGGESPILGTNFKINFKGNIVPVWLEKLFGKEYIYAALAAICVGTIFDMNLVEVSQALKDYRGC